MGTYDTRGGHPISPSLPDYAPSELEEDVLGVLESLDAARTNAREVLPQVFKRIVAKRFAVGQRIAIKDIQVKQGLVRCAEHARVIAHLVPAIDLSYPERTKVTVQCVTLLRDGTETDNLVSFEELVLGQYYNKMWARNPKSERDLLIELVAELEDVRTDQQK